MECGLGWFTVAAWHMGLHAVWRAYQFLHAPSLIHMVTRSARPAPVWLQQQPLLFNAAQQRFWLDPIIDWLLVRPTHSIARDLQDFDEKVVTRMVGLPNQVRLISSLEQSESGPDSYSSEHGEVGRGRGVVGRFMEGVASGLHWFEEHLVLKGGGEGLGDAIQHIGAYAKLIERLLSQPRYLLLIIMATFVVII